MPIEIGIEEIVATVGSGAVLGGVTGYAAKKMLKLAAVLVVLEIGAVVALERFGVLDVYWTGVAQSVGLAENTDVGILSVASTVISLVLVKRNWIELA